MQNVVGCTIPSVNLRCVNLMHLQFTDGIVQPTTKTIFNFFARPIAKTRDIINILTRGGDYRGDTSTPQHFGWGDAKVKCPPHFRGAMPL